MVLPLFFLELLYIYFLTFVASIFECMIFKIIFYAFFSFMEKKNYFKSYFKLIIKTFEKVCHKC